MQSAGLSVLKRNSLLFLHTNLGVDINRVYLLFSSFQKSWCLMSLQIWSHHLFP